MILGITGGICTGKSVATDVIRSLGVRVVDCDEVSHYISGYDPAILQQIAAALGDAVFQAGGALNRRAVADIILADPRQRQRLEAILHPPIARVVDANIAYARGARQHLVISAPLLIEAGLEDRVDHLWVISSTRARQLKRLHDRSGVDAATGEKWIAAQMPLEQKEQHADTVLANNGTLDEFRQLVKQEWHQLVDQK
jgi:dephospho-CoA kinase